MDDVILVQRYKLMVKVNIITGDGVQSKLVSRKAASETRIKVTPEIADAIVSAGIKIVSLVVMGIVSIALKQNLFPE